MSYAINEIVNNKIAIEKKYDRVKLKFIGDINRNHWKNKIRKSLK